MNALHIARRMFICPVTLCMMLSAAACSSPGADAPATLPSVMLPPLCDGTLYSLEVTPEITTIQEQSNVIARRRDALFIVESGANAVSRFDLPTQTLTRTLVDVGNDQNPYDIFLIDDLALVTNYLGASVTAASTITGEVIAEFGHDRLISPAGIAATSTHVYVSDVEFGRGENGFGAGVVHVFERGSWTWRGTIPVAKQNPHYISALPDEPNTLIVVDVGAVGFEGGRYRQLSEGAIERWRFTGDPLSPEVHTALIPAQKDPGRDGAPGRPMFSSKGQLIYFVSATAPIMLSLDVETMQWVHGPDEPVVLYASTQDTLHAGDITSEGLAMILSYNQDALYLYDTTCDRMIAGPVELGTSPDDLEGPLGVVVSSPNEAYFITSLSKRLGKISLKTR